MHKNIFIYQCIYIVVERAGAVVSYMNAITIVIVDEVIRLFI
jgi:hypothetical protein